MHMLPHGGGANCPRTWPNRCGSSTFGVSGQRRSAVEEKGVAAALGARGGGLVRVHNDTFAILRAGLPSGAEPRGVAVMWARHQLRRHDPRTGALPLSPLSGRSPATGAGAAARRGGPVLRRRAPRTAAAARPRWRQPCRPLRASSMYELIEALHLEKIPPYARHELSPVLFEVAAAGDAVRAPRRAAAEEIVFPGDGRPGPARPPEVETPVLLGAACSRPSSPTGRCGKGVAGGPGPKAVRSWSPRRPCSARGFWGSTTSPPPDAYARAAGPVRVSRAGRDSGEPNGSPRRIHGGTRGRGAKGSGPAPDTPGRRHDR